MNGGPDISLWLKQLSDRSVSVRERATRLLGQSTYTDALIRRTAVDALAPLLSDANAYIRIRAAFGLARLSEDPGVGLVALQTALADPHRDVRSAAAAALGDLGRQAAPALPSLRAAAVNESPSVQNQIEKAIERIESSS